MAESVFMIEDHLDNPCEEAYKVLRSNIQFCNVDRSIKVLTITSCRPGEGKTTTTTNLAVSMAKSGLKVLLVDADLRKPLTAKHKNLNKTIGLSNILSGSCTLAEAWNKTNIEGLYFVSSGPKPPNPAEMIGSARFTAFLQEAREAFDMVIIDTPPLGSVIDAAVIAAHTDGVVLVIQSKAIDYQSARRMLEQIGKTNTRILGVVLNKVYRRDLAGYYGYYPYYGSTDEKAAGNRLSGLLGLGRFRIFQKRNKVTV